LKLKTKAVLLDLEDRKVVLFHQIDDGFDFFDVVEFQGALLCSRLRRLGKSVLGVRSSKERLPSAAE
jgi:hypothetical protein